MEKRGRGDGWGVMNWAAIVHPPEGLARGVYVVLALVALALIGIWGTLLVRVVGSVVDFEHAIPINTADDLNKVLLGLGGIIGATTGVPFLVWRTLISQRQNEISQRQNLIAQENLHSTTMAKAIEQLGAMKSETSIVLSPSGTETETHTANETKVIPNLEVRLGAIYLLEKLARDNQELHWPIMEILCAYVRGNAGPPQEDTSLPPGVDVQAAITVIGRRSAEQLKAEDRSRRNSINSDEYRLNLSYTHLAGANFDGLDFRYANFGKSCLAGSSFNNSWLSGGSFSSANIFNAIFFHTYLEGADLMYVDARYSNFFFAFMEGAKLGDGNFEFASIHSVMFDDATIDGAIFSSSKGLNIELISKTWGNGSTILPEGLDAPKNSRWVQGETTSRARRMEIKERQEFWLDEAQRRRERELAERSSR